MSGPDRMAWAAAMVRLSQFVHKHSHRSRQRTEGWRKARRKRVGASEVGSVLGLNPYPNSTIEDVVAEKAGVVLDARQSRDGTYLNWYCVFGTVMEDAITLVVEQDLGTPVIGDTINIPASYPEHANSPDGFGVVWLIPPASPAPSAHLASLGMGGGGWRAALTEMDPDRASVLVNEMAQTADPSRWTFWTSDMGPVPAGAVPVPVLFEFKSPPSRPVGQRRNPKKGPVPRHYTPQMWSGIDLSSEAGVGMAIFVDAGFRLCALEDVGFTSRFNRSLHRKKLTKAEERVIARGAWATGVVGLYAAEPLPPNPDGSPAELRDVGSREQTWENPQLPLEFDRVCRLIDDGTLAYRAGPPSFADGRGITPEAARKPDPAGPDEKHPHLIGVIGWKLFQVEYVPVPKRAGFVEEIRPILQTVISEAKEIEEAGDDPEVRAAAWMKKYRPELLGCISAADDLFADTVEVPSKPKLAPPSLPAARRMPFFPKKEGPDPVDDLFADSTPVE